MFENEVTLVFSCFTTVVNSYCKEVQDQPLTTSVHVIYNNIIATKLILILE